MRTIRWGITGRGDVTERKSSPGFGKAVHSELVAVMRRNGALAADYARRHAVIQTIVGRTHRARRMREHRRVGRENRDGDRDDPRGIPVAFVPLAMPRDRKE